MSHQNWGGAIFYRNLVSFKNDLNDFLELFGIKSEARFHLHT